MTYANRLDPLVHKGTWYWNRDGKLQRLMPPAMDSESNWIVSNLSFRCQKWHKIFWELKVEFNFCDPQHGVVIS